MAFDGVTMRLGRNIGAKFGNPAIEQRTALLAEPLIDDRGQIPQAVDLRDEGTQACTASDDPNDVVPAQDMRLANAKLAQFGAHGGRNRRIHAHVRHEGIGIRLATFDEFRDIADFGGEVADLQRFAGIGRMLALDRADGLLAIWRGDEKDRVLTAVLRLAKYFDGTP